MDFRQSYCAWCGSRDQRVAECEGCPRYVAYHDSCMISSADLCSVCLNRDNQDIEIFCRTNRQFQEGSQETFECYKFSLDRGLRSERS